MVCGMQLYNEGTTVFITPSASGGVTIGSGPFHGNLIIASCSKSWNTLESRPVPKRWMMRNSDGCPPQRSELYWPSSCVAGGLGSEEESSKHDFKVLFLGKLEVKYASNCWSFQRCLKCFPISLLEKIYKFDWFQSGLKPPKYALKELTASNPSRKTLQGVHWPYTVILFNDVFNPTKHLRKLSLRTMHLLGEGLERRRHFPHFP